MATVHHLGFVMYVFGPPTKGIWWSLSLCKTWLESVMAYPVRLDVQPAKCTANVPLTRSDYEKILNIYHLVPQSTLGDCDVNRYGGSVVVRSARTLVLSCTFICL